MCDGKAACLHGAQLAVVAARFSKLRQVRASIEKEFKPVEIRSDLAERMLRWARDPQQEEFDVSASSGRKRFAAVCELLTAEACEAASKVVFLCMHAAFTEYLH